MTGVHILLNSSLTSVVWHPAQIYILMSMVTGDPVRSETVLFYIRMATCNQICDPWIYIICQRRVKRKRKTSTDYTNNTAFPSLLTPIITFGCSHASACPRHLSCTLIDWLIGTLQLTPCLAASIPFSYPWTQSITGTTLHNEVSVPSSFSCCYVHFIPFLLCYLIKTFPLNSFSPLSCLFVALVPAFISWG